MGIIIGRKVLETQEEIVTSLSKGIPTKHYDSFRTQLADSPMNDVIDVTTADILQSNAIKNNYNKPLLALGLLSAGVLTYTLGLSKGIKSIGNVKNKISKFNNELSEDEKDFLYCEDCGYYDD